jgi:hypothetical protein
MLDDDLQRLERRIVTATNLKSLFTTFNIKRQGLRNIQERLFGDGRIDDVLFLNSDELSEIIDFGENLLNVVHRALEVYTAFSYVETDEDLIKIDEEVKYIHEQCDGFAAQLKKYDNDRDKKTWKDFDIDSGDRDIATKFFQNACHILAELYNSEIFDGAYTLPEINAKKDELRLFITPTMAVIDEGESMGPGLAKTDISMEPKKPLAKIIEEQDYHLPYHG